MHIGKTDHDTRQDLMNRHFSFSGFIRDHHDHAVFIFYDRFCVASKLGDVFHFFSPAFFLLLVVSNLLVSYHVKNGLSIPEWV